MPGSAGVAHRPAKPPLTIMRRMVLSTAWWVFGMLFFYVALVVMSLMSKNVTLVRLSRNGWPRVTSRATGVLTVPFFSLSLIVSPASLWSFFFLVMAFCSHLVHLIIVSSDLRAFDDEEVINVMFREDPMHAVFRLLPLKTVHVFGSFATLCFALLVLERTYGAAMRSRQPRLPTLFKAGCAVVWSMFLMFLVDRLYGTIVTERPQQEILYPLAFMSDLFVSAAVAVWRDRRVAAETLSVSGEPSGEQGDKKRN